MAKLLPKGLGKVQKTVMSVGEDISMFHYIQPEDEMQYASAIDWIVAQEKNNAVLLVSKRGLYCRSFGIGDSVSWNDSMLRKWLNGIWYIHSIEKYGHGHFIVPVNSDNPLDVGKPSSPDYPPAEGVSREKNDDEDYVFLLSSEEADEILASENILLKPEYYVVKDTDRASENVKWWVRANSKNESNIIDENGNPGICKANDDTIFVRPAIWVDNFYIKRSYMDLKTKWERLLYEVKHGRFDYDNFREAASGTYYALHAYDNVIRDIPVYPKSIVEIIILIARFSEIRLKEETEEHILAVRAANSFCEQSIQWKTIYRRMAQGTGSLPDVFVTRDIKGNIMVVDANTFSLKKPLDINELEKMGCFTL